MGALAVRTRLLSSAAALALAACASDPMPEIRAAYDRGDYAMACERLAELVADDESNAHVYQLECSMVDLARGDPKAAEAALRNARNRLDELGGTSITQSLGAMLLDDRQLDYSGADYEHVLVRAMLALSNLMAGGGDAEAYSIQVLQRQLELIQSYADEKTNEPNPKEKFKLVAFGSYLRGILNDDKPLRLGVAKEAFARVVELEPDFGLGKESLERVTNGQHSAPGHGAVHVIALLGRGPYRIEVDEPVSRTAFALAQIIWSIVRDRAVIPNITDVPIPALSFHPHNPTSVIIGVDGQDVASTEVVTDVNATAQAEFEAMHDHIVARAVLRRAFKIVVTEGVREAVNPSKSYDQGSTTTFFTELAIAIGGMIWTGMEGADLRCWSLLPATFQAARIEMPEGEHEITVRAAVGPSPVGRPQTVRVLVRNGFNTHVVVLAPTPEGGPTPLTSDPAAVPSADSEPGAAR